MTETSLVIEIKSGDRDRRNDRDKFGGRDQSGDRDRRNDRDKFGGRDQSGDRDRRNDRDKFGDRDQNGDQDHRNDRDKFGGRDQSGDRDRRNDRDKFGDRDQNGDQDHRNDRDKFGGRDQSGDQDRRNDRDKFGVRDQSGDKDHRNDRDKFGDQDQSGDRDRRNDRDKFGDRDQSGDRDRRNDRDKFGDRDQPDNSDQYDDRDHISPYYQLSFPPSRPPSCLSLTSSFSGSEFEEEGTPESHISLHSGVRSRSNNEIVENKQTGSYGRMSDNSDQFLRDGHGRTGSGNSSGNTRGLDRRISLRNGRGVKGRVVYSDESLQFLQRAFETVGGYASKEQQNELATVLNVPKSNIRIWFQNQRSKKYREGNLTKEREDTPSASAEMSKISSQQYGLPSIPLNLLPPWKGAPHGIPQMSFNNFSQTTSPLAEDMTSYEW